MKLIAAAIAAIASSFASAETPTTEPPRLCVLIVVDQLIPEQLERLEPWLDGGLGRMWREGRVYRRAQLDHALTFTAPGHVSAATGMWPSHHGVVANRWYDRETRRNVYCCEDPDARMVTADGVQSDQKDYRRSPVLSAAPSISHFVEAHAEGARTIAICAKDRAAIALAGRAGELAIWWDWRQASGFVGSSFYGDSIPDWVNAWNKDWRERASGYLWEKSYEGELRGAGVAPDERDGEYSINGWTRSMPHKFREVAADAPTKELSRLGKQVYESALSDQFVADLTMRALATNEYGTDATLDLLAVSFASTDTVGHLFGPFSVEVTDVVLRLDALLAKIFADLDERVGKGRWVCGLTADHGVLALPEELVQRGVGARRVPKKQVAGDRRALKAHIAKLNGEDLVLKIQPEGVYLDQVRMAELKLDAEQVRKDVREYAVANLAGVARGYTQEEIKAAIASGTDDAMLCLASNSYFAGRSPDVFLQQEPWCLLGEVAGTTHGSPYAYDLRVPLMFLGPGFESEMRFEHATSCDLVPTLLSASGIETDHAFDGRDLFKE